MMSAMMCARGLALTGLSALFVVATCPALLGPTVLLCCEMKSRSCASSVVGGIASRAMLLMLCSAGRPAATATRTATTAHTASVLELKMTAIFLFVCLFCWLELKWCCWPRPTCSLYSAWQPGTHVDTRVGSRRPGWGLDTFFARCGRFAIRECAVSGGGGKFASAHKCVYFCFVLLRFFGFEAPRRGKLKILVWRSCSEEEKSRAANRTRIRWCCCCEIVFAAVRWESHCLEEKSQLM